MKRFLISRICCIVMVCFAVSGFADEPSYVVAETNSANPFGNPIMPGADPDAVVVSNSVWLYPTWSRNGRGSFFSFSSTNLTTWRQDGPDLDFKDVKWIGDDGQKQHFAWAPDLVENKGQYYFYYSVGPQGITPSRIGVAVGQGPQGPFKDSGKSLLTGGKGYEAIDPMVFTDPASGKSYLYAGGSAGSKLRVFEMNPDMVSFSKEIPVETPPNFTEGVYMIYLKGTYFLSYSHGDWQRSSYSVHYATGKSPVGPWTYHGAILTTDNIHKGPGHHSFFQNPLTGEWLIAYHRWERQTGDGPYHGSRQICIDRVQFDKDGLMLPIVMTGE